MRTIRRAAAAFALALALVACGNDPDRYDRPRTEDEIGPQAYPADYKAELLAYLRIYLNNPAGVRDAMIAEPVLRQIGKGRRYIVCLKFNARKSDGAYAGNKEYLAAFLSGRFDQLVEQVREFCQGAVYRPFPELETLTR